MTPPILLFDGICNLCTWSVKLLFRFDRKRNIKVASVQSEIGQLLLNRHGLPTDIYKSSILIHNNTAYTKSDAALEVCALMSYPWPIFKIFKCVPKCLRDWSYNFLVTHRYKLFGKAKVCLIPTPKNQTHFATMEDIQ